VVVAVEVKLAQLVVMAVLVVVVGQGRVAVQLALATLLTNHQQVVTAHPLLHIKDLMVARVVLVLGLVAAVGLVLLGKMEEERPAQEVMVKRQQLLAQA
jgi:hypothetical protein